MKEDYKVSCSLVGHYVSIVYYDNLIDAEEYYNHLLADPSYTGGWVQLDKFDMSSGRFITLAYSRSGIKKG